MNFTVQMSISSFIRASAAIALESRALFQAEILDISVRQLVTSLSNAATRDPEVYRRFRKRANLAVDEVARTSKPSDANAMISAGVPGTVIPVPLQFKP